MNNVIENVNTEQVVKPLKERVRSKIWKVKKDAFDELSKIVIEN